MSTNLSVLVSGATGNQGGAVARALLANGYHVRALSRNPGSDAAKALAGLGAEVVAGDFDDDASLRRAADGVDAAVQRFSRLFMLPNVGHCEGGDGPDRIDLVSPLVRWVEHGKAPNRVVARQRADGEVVRSRPIYDYPVTAAYDGTGDIDKARNFVPDAPAHRPDDHIDWLGSFG